VTGGRHTGRGVTGRHTGRGVTGGRDTGRGVRAHVPDRDAYLRRWSELHGGYDVRRSRMVRGWLSMVHVVAAPLVRLGAGPGAVTLGGIVLGLTVPLVALGAVDRPRLALLCSVLIVVSGVADNLDGAVAVLTDRASRTGFVLDSVADRIGDLGYLVALWLVGAPGLLVAAGGAGTFLQEYTRARGAAAGMAEVGVVSIAERPTRIIVAALFLFGAGLFPDGAGQWASAGAVVWAAAHAIGFVQVALGVRRALR